jgi:DNA-binding transcriptional regulator LsrR (DeoR family)
MITRKYSAGKNTDADSLEMEMLIRAVWMYYMEDQTQQQISEHLGVSRIKVTRLLQEARKRHIVEITIHSPITTYLSLEHDLRQYYGLKDAIVTTEAEEGEALYRVLAKASAQVLEQRLRPGMNIGLGLGRTIGYLPEFFRPGKQIECTFTSLTGGTLNSSSSDDNYSSLLWVAEAVGGKVQYIHAPASVSSAEIKAALMNDEAIREALNFARHCDMAMLSVGSMVEPVTLHQYGLIDDEDVRQLRSLGAVGDAIGQFYNELGQEVPARFKDRMIGLAIHDLRSIPLTVVVAGGTRKYQAILAALRGKIADILITDCKTAQWLLNQKPLPGR